MIKYIYFVSDCPIVGSSTITLFTCYICVTVIEWLLLPQARQLADTILSQSIYFVDMEADNSL